MPACTAGSWAEAGRPSRASGTVLASSSPSWIEMANSCNFVAAVTLYRMPWQCSRPTSCTTQCSIRWMRRWSRSLASLRSTATGMHGTNGAAIGMRRRTGSHKEKGRVKVAMLASVAPKMRRAGTARLWRAVKAKRAQRTRAGARRAASLTLTAGEIRRPEGSARVPPRRRRASDFRRRPRSPVSRRPLVATEAKAARQRRAERSD
mmetsp:Transcript_75567/g.122020  ORF Transcript_75567/g.122020 Transcript_75567/m.122020 type:complete len:206 (+) Transcript_75567:1046-1663(+)